MAAAVLIPDGPFPRRTGTKADKRSGGGGGAQKKEALRFPSAKKGGGRTGPVQEKKVSAFGE